MTKLSRSKIELFLECPRCFWLDVKCGVKRPQPAPYTINSAIDYLLKQEFDLHREKGTAHPVMERHAIDAIPYRTPEIDKWRHNFTGVQHYHEPTNFLVAGAVDDIWVNPVGELIVIDYKATGANQHQVYDSYRRQMEIYQWLLRANGFKVSDTGYFLFARVNKANGFNSTPLTASASDRPVLSFDLFIEPYEGDDSWIPPALEKIREAFNSDEPPVSTQTCEYCRYRVASGEVLTE